MPDRAKGFAEIYRTLKPGGQACAASWAEMVWAGMTDVALHRVKHWMQVVSAEDHWAVMSNGAGSIAMMKASMCAAEWTKKSKAALRAIGAAAGPVPRARSAAAAMAVGRK